GVVAERAEGAAHGGVHVAAEVLVPAAGAEANVRRLGQLLGPVLLLLEGSAGGLLHDAEVGGAELAGLEVLERRLPLGAEAGEVREQELLLELADDTTAREVGDERRLRVPLEGAVARVD